MSSWSTRVATAFTAAVSISAGSALADAKQDVKDFCAGQREPYRNLIMAQRSNNTPAAVAATQALLTHQTQARVFGAGAPVNVEFEAHGKPYTTTMSCDDIMYRQCGGPDSIKSLWPTAGFYHKVHERIVMDVGTQYETKTTLANSKAGSGKYWPDRPDTPSEDARYIKRDLINIHKVKPENFDNAVKQCEARAQELGILSR